MDNVSNLRKQHSFSYFGERGFPLMWRQAPIKDKAILTVEQYDKWYNLYLIYPDKQILAVESNTVIWMQAMEEFEGVSVLNHCFNPEFIDLLIKKANVEMDPLAYELIVGRWTIEVIN